MLQAGKRWRCRAQHPESSCSSAPCSMASQQEDPCPDAAADTLLFQAWHTAHASIDCFICLQQSSRAALKVIASNMHIRVLKKGSCTSSLTAGGPHTWQKACSGQASDARAGHWCPHASSFVHLAPVGRCTQGTQHGMVQPATAQGLRHGVQACRQNLSAIETFCCIQLAVISCLHGIFQVAVYVDPAQQQ